MPSQPNSGGQTARASSRRWQPPHFHAPTRTRWRGPTSAWTPGTFSPWQPPMATRSPARTSTMDAWSHDAARSLLMVVVVAAAVVVVVVVVVVVRGTSLHLPTDVTSPPAATARQWWMVRPPSATSPPSVTLTDFVDYLAVYFPARGESSEVVRQSHPPERALCEGGSDQGHLRPRHQRGGPRPPHPSSCSGAPTAAVAACVETRQVRHRSRPCDAPSPGSASWSWSTALPATARKAWPSAPGGVTLTLGAPCSLRRRGVARPPPPPPQGSSRALRPSPT
jgi:hypothetical protein